MNALLRFLQTIGWGIYCACSWTWCIGMYLPVIMLRDWGWPGVLVFAVPNVLGCAAFGYVVRTRRASDAMIARHRWAMIAFSLVTIAYHLFFAGFLTMRLGSGADAVQLWPAAMLAMFVFLGGAALSRVATRAWPALAAVIYIISLFAFSQFDLRPLQTIDWTGERGAIDLALISPVIIMGFLLCPYLDLTFHRALRESPSRHCFAAFGIAFFIMIVFTCAYHDIGTMPIRALHATTAWTGRLLVAHLFAQMIFTVAAHWREARALMSDDVSRRVSYIPLVSLAALAAAAIFRFSFEVNEEIYLRWLVFYGLAFPAYVLTFIGPWRVKTLSRANAIRLGIILCALLPLYELGFIHDWTGVMPIAVGLLLATLWTGSAGPRRRTQR